MSKNEKLIRKIFDGQHISYDDAEKILVSLGFATKSEGSHHVFRKKGFPRNISIKKRPQLLPYQIKDLKEVLQEHGYPKTQD